jgi:hypothetical protein
MQAEARDTESPLNSVPQEYTMDCTEDNGDVWIRTTTHTRSDTVGVRLQHLRAPSDTSVPFNCPLQTNVFVCHGW